MTPCLLRLKPPIFKGEICSRPLALCIIQPPEPEPVLDLQQPGKSKYSFSANSSSEMWIIVPDPWPVNVVTARQKQKLSVPPVQGKGTWKMGGSIRMPRGINRQHHHSPSCIHTPTSGCSVFQKCLNLHLQPQKKKKGGGGGVGSWTYIDQTGKRGDVASSWLWTGWCVWIWISCSDPERCGEKCYFGAWHTIQ